MDTLFTIAAAATFVLAILSKRPARAAAYSANLVWSAIASVVLVVMASVALWRGNVSLAVKEMVILVAVLFMTGIIPGLLLALRKNT